MATGYPPPGPGGNPHYHQLSGNHLQPQQQISHSPSPPNSYHKEDQRNQRQHVKVLRQQRDISECNVYDKFMSATAHINILLFLSFIQIPPCQRQPTHHHQENMT